MLPTITRLTSHRIPNMSDIIIIGAGLSGTSIAKTLASSLTQARVRLFDQATGERAPNYSLTLLDSTIERCESVWQTPGGFKKCGVDAGLGGQGDMSKRYINGRTGAIVEGPSTSPSKRIDRQALDSLLKQGLQVEYNKKRSKIENTDQGVVVHFEDGTTAEGSLVLACDGVHSTIRTELGIKSTVLLYVVYTGQRKLSAQEAEPFLKATTTIKTAFFPSASMTFSFNSIGKDGGRLQWIYSRNPTSNDPLFTPERQNAAANEIPSALYGELHTLASEAVEPFKSLLQSISPEKGDRMYNWLMREVPAEQVLEAQEGKVVFLGDSIHAQPIWGSVFPAFASMSADAVAGDKEAIKLFSMAWRSVNL